MNDNKIMIMLSSINQKYNKIVPSMRKITLEEENEAIAKIDEYTNDQTIDNLIRLCIYLINMQIYTDGNSRTIFEFLNIELKKWKYKIDIDLVRLNYKYLRNFFPTVFLFENEEISVDDIDRIKRYIISEKDKIR